MANNHIAVFPKGSEEWRKLYLAACEFDSREKLLQFKVKKIYYDYGQDWEWTTILATDPTVENEVYGTWQYLTPAEQRDILNCPIGKLEACIDNMLEERKKTRRFRRGI